MPELTVITSGFGEPGGFGVPDVLKIIGPPLITSLASGLFERGSDIDIVAGGANGQVNNCPDQSKRWKLDCFNQLVPVKTRRRRKRMLTCSDKADLAFLIGQLGKGAAGTSAVSALLSKC